MESKEQIIGIAQSVKASGAGMLRGGAFKPRTSPYDFQGLKAEGIELLLEAKKLTGMPIVTEIMNANHLPLFEDVDVIQVGARNMQNFELLKELGKTNKPILLKRGLANTLKELLMSAEYIMSEGNENVILCERGIRTFETYTRNTLDLSAIPMLKDLSHLPVVIDPSHATGIAKLVKPMAMAAVAAGADAVMIEVHNDPQHALSDGPQSVTPQEFDDIATAGGKIREVLFQCLARHNELIDRNRRAGADRRIAGEGVQARAGESRVRVDRNDAVQGIARLDGAIDGELNPQTIAAMRRDSDRDLPGRRHRLSGEHRSDDFRSTRIVFDCCGVKRAVCDRCFAIAEAVRLHVRRRAPDGGQAYLGLSRAARRTCSTARP